MHPDDPSQPPPAAPATAENRPAAAPRVLVVDDDPEVGTLAREILGKVAACVDLCNRPVELLEIANRGPCEYDVLLLDVDMPEIDGLALRRLLRAKPGWKEVPIVFSSAASGKWEKELNEALEGAKLVLKPVTPHELRNAVLVASGRFRHDRGQMPEAFDRILADIVQRKETGVLTAIAGTTLKRVVFREGNVVFAASNDPREVIGQVFVRAGLVTEEDLAAAFRHRDSSPENYAPLGVVLTALRKITPEQCRTIFYSKIRESVLDLFLWRGGLVEWAAVPVEEAEQPFHVGVDLAKLRIEGLKRRVRWRHIQQRFPDPSVRFDRIADLPADFVQDRGTAVLAGLIERGASMAEMFVELRGQDFAIGAKLLELVEAGILRVRGEAAPAASEAEETAPPPSPASLQEGIRRLEAGDLAGARNELVAVLASDPSNVLARRRLEEVEHAIVGRAQRALSPRARVRLARPLDQLTRQPLAPHEAFVVTRLAAAAMSVEDLVHVCPFGAPEVMQILEKLVEKGVVAKTA